MLQLINPFFSHRMVGHNSEIMAVNSCHINYSSLSSFYGKGKSNCYSIKYVLAGLEQYRLNGKPYNVGAGNYLVVGQGSDISVKIESKQVVEGVRFFLPKELVSDVWCTLNKSPEQLLEPPEDEEIPVFFENKFGGKHDSLGSFIGLLGSAIKTNKLADELTDDSLFYWLALELCKQQNHHLLNLNVIPAQKKSTKEELYRRLIATREYMQETFTQPITLGELARIANISEFHFLRCFKAAFGESPYQYLLHLRLQLAKYLLISGNQSITETALACGFKEVQAFSKLFRKAFGKGPSAFMQLYLK